MSVAIERIRAGVIPVSSWSPTSTRDKLFRYIDIGSVDRESKSVTGATELPVDVAPSRARQLLKANDVLVSTVRPNLNAVALVPDHFDGAVGSTGFTVLRANPSRLLPQYLFHWVRTPIFVADMVKQATGASYPAISDRIVLDSTLPLPPLAQQRRIAEILDKTDAIRRTRREAIALTEGLLRSVFLDVFGDPVTNPKRWPEYTVGDVCARFGGALQTGPFGSQLHASDYTYEGVPVVMPQDLINGGISTAQIARVSAAHVARLDRHKLELGDVVFSRRGDVARFAVVEDHQVGWLCGTGCLRIRFARAPLIAAFLRGELAHPSKRQWLESEAKGTTMPNLNTSILGKLSIRMPPMNIQMAFEQINQRAHAMRSEQCESSAEAAHLFNAIVDRVFCGQEIGLE
jgi:type I restriction enzyme S subunit